MASYFFDLIGPDQHCLDDEGIEVESHRVPQVALSNARDCLAADMQGGVIDLRYRIEVRAETGEITHVLSFQDAATVLP